MRPEAYLHDFTATQYGKVPAQWLASPEVRKLSHSTRSVWLALIVLLNGTTRKGAASYQEIASHASCNRKTAMKAVKLLEEAGLLRHWQRISKYGIDFMPNAYELLEPPSLRAAEGEAAPPASPENELLRAYYEHIQGPLPENYHFPPKEQSFVAGLIQKHGFAAVYTVLRYAVSRFGSWKPNTIFAIKRYVLPGLALYKQEQERVASDAGPEGPFPERAPDLAVPPPECPVGGPVVVREREVRTDLLLALEEALEGALGRLPEPSSDAPAFKWACWRGQQSSLRAQVAHVRAALLSGRWEDAEQVIARLRG